MEANATRITFVRHGHVHNPHNIIYGRLPGFGLSRIGEQQVKAAAQELAQASPTALYASPQQRALETAAILQRVQPQLKPIISPLIDEIDCYFEGRPADEVEARGWDLYTGFEDGYESPEEIAARGGRFIDNVRRAHAGEHVIAVSHGDVIAFSILWALKEPVKVILKRSLDRFGLTDGYPATASLTTLIYRGTSPDEIPNIEYVRPYDDDMALAALS